MKKAIFTLLGFSALYAQELVPRAEYFTGVFDDGAAEISAFHPASNRLYIVNAAIDGVEVFDISDLDAITPVDTIDVSVAEINGKAVNSVDVHGDLLALAIERKPKQDNGLIGIFDANDGSLIDTIPAGALPDMVKFSHDGKYIMSANEGEPSDDYRNDPEGSVTHVEIVGSNVANWIVTQIDFNEFDSKATELEAAGVRIPRPMGASVSQDLEPEYIAYSSDNSLAFVALQENNAVAKIDVATGDILEILGLGKKDHSLPGNEIDIIPNDTINIVNEKVVSLAMPDAIGAYTVGNKSYFVTANEGDGREYIAEFDEENETDCLANNQIEYPDVEWDDDDGCFYEAYVDEGKLSKLDLDMTVFDSTDFNMLPEKLVVIATEGDTDGDDLVEEITLFGGRSFSIFDEDGALVFDSGSDFENEIAKNAPDFFNTTNDENVLEDRSRKKGPEPEGVEIVEVFGMVYALIGIERQGGVMVYDITDPTNVKFVQYYIDRDFAAVEENELTATHLGPEGILYIPAADAPEGKGLVVVSNEVSGSLEFLEFDVEEPESLVSQVELNNFEIVNNVVRTQQATLIEVFNVEGQLVASQFGTELDLAQTGESLAIVKVEAEVTSHLVK